ncbi:MAG: hypothetical protein ABFS09_00905 [Thermodesulfobacteriota bacterium]
MTSHRAPTPLLMTLLVSSETEVLLGNGMAMVDWLFLLSIVLVVTFHILTLQP